MQITISVACATQEEVVDVVQRLLSASPGAGAKQAPAKPAPVAAPPLVPDGDVTADHVRRKLEEVCDIKGAATAKTVLKEFAAARGSELKVADYAAFVKRCSEVVAS